MPRRTIVLVSAVLVIAVALAVLGWVSATRASAVERAATEAVAAAGAAAQAIFSYDYRGFDASVNNGRQFVTGDFATEYAQTTANLKASAEKEQAIVRAEVSAAGVVRATADEAEVLLYVNQYRRNVNITGEKVDQNRVVLTLVPAGGEWKVVHAIAI